MLADAEHDRDVGLFHPVVTLADVRHLGDHEIDMVERGFGRARLGDAKAVVIGVGEAAHERDHAVDPVRRAEVHLIEQESLGSVAIGAGYDEMAEARDIGMGRHVSGGGRSHVDVEFEQRAGRGLRRAVGLADAQHLRLGGRNRLHGDADFREVRPQGL